MQGVDVTLRSVVDFVDVGVKDQHQDCWQMLATVVIRGNPQDFHHVVTSSQD